MLNAAKEKGVNDLGESGRKKRFEKKTTISASEAKPFN